MPFFELTPTGPRPQDRWPDERARLLAELAEARRIAARAWECVARLLEAVRKLEPRGDK